jgi:hypothetical protein
MARDTLRRFVFGAPRRRSVYAALEAIVLTVCVIGPRAQTPPVAATAGKSGSLMKPFVFLFRQSSPLSEADQKRRAEEVQVWAQRQNDEGHKLDPRALGEQNHRIGPGARSGSTSQRDEPPLTAVLFVEARDFAEAVKIAETHPALRYGVISVEVRPWSPPPALATPSRPQFQLDDSNSISR